MFLISYFLLRFCFVLKSLAVLFYEFTILVIQLAFSNPQTLQQGLFLLQDSVCIFIIIVISGTHMIQKLKENRWNIVLRTSWNLIEETLMTHLKSFFSIFHCFPILVVWSLYFVCFVCLLDAINMLFWKHCCCRIRGSIEGNIDLGGSSPNCACNINPLSTNPAKWSNTLKQFVDKSKFKWIN